MAPQISAASRAKSQLSPWFAVTGDPEPGAEDSCGGPPPKSVPHHALRVFGKRWWEQGGRLTTKDSGAGVPHVRSGAPPAAGVSPPRALARVPGSSGLAEANKMRFDRTRPRVPETTPLPRPRPPAQSSGPCAIPASRPLRNPRRGCSADGRAARGPFGRRAPTRASRAILGQGYLARRSRCIHHIPCAPRREAGREAGAPAWWLRGYAGDCVPRPAALLLPTAAAHLQHTPPPLCAAFSLKACRLSGARRAPSNAKQPPRGHPQ